jgi:molybdate transport repressor ModE-like protein
MLDVKRLKVLREVANQGSFSGAADALFVSQSAVSQQIAALEREAGMPLVERTSKGPVLTVAGQRLVEHADAVFSRLHEAERELAEIAGLEGGELRLASFPSASSTLVTRAISDFSRLHPKVALTFCEAEPEESMPRLRAGDFDLALTFDYPSVPVIDERDVHLELLMEETMHVVLPADHPLADEPELRMQQLADEAWLCGRSPSSCSELVRTACSIGGFDAKISFESDDYHVLQGFVAAGLGVTLLPDLAIATIRSDVVARPLHRAPTRRIWAASRPEGARSPATGAMVDLLREAADDFVASQTLAAIS